jgi:hypothetical protein
VNYSVKGAGTNSCVFFRLVRDASTRSAEAQGGAL